jgi:hypothetical protein
VLTALSDSFDAAAPQLGFILEAVPLAIIAGGSSTPSADALVWPPDHMVGARPGRICLPAYLAKTRSHTQRHGLYSGQSRHPFCLTEPSKKGEQLAFHQY